MRDIYYISSAPKSTPNLTDQRCSTSLPNPSRLSCVLLLLLKLANMITGWIPSVCSNQHALQFAVICCRRRCRYRETLRSTRSRRLEFVATYLQQVACLNVIHSGQMNPVSRIKAKPRNKRIVLSLQW